MADVKISGLSGATLPLGGGELVELSQLNGGSYDSVSATAEQISYSARKIGVFLDTADQTGSSASATAVALNTNSINTLGVTVASTSRITVAEAGVYNIHAMLQFANSDASDHNVNVWVAKNGTAVAATNSVINVPKVSDGGRQHFSSTDVLTLAAGDYVQIMWLPANNAVTLVFTAAGAIAPSTPSALVSVERIAL